MAKEQNVLELLVDQHAQIRKLFAEIELATGKRRQSLFEDLVRLLAAHETAEEEVVHPAARRELDRGDDIVEGRLKEEDDAKRALADLYDLGVDHPEFDGRLRSLANAVTQHARHEESQEFARLAKTVKPDELRKMADVVRAAETIAPTRPHPRTGESALANLAVGPPLAVFDRARDAIRDWRSKGR